MVIIWELQAPSHAVVVLKTATAHTQAHTIRTFGFHGSGEKQTLGTT